MNANDVGDDATCSSSSSLTVLSLDAILASRSASRDDSSSAVNECVRRLRSRGWTWVSLPERLQRSATRAAESVERTITWSASSSASHRPSDDDDRARRRRRDERASRRLLDRASIRVRSDAVATADDDVDASLVALTRECDDVLSEIARTLSPRLSSSLVDDESRGTSSSSTTFEPPTTTTGPSLLEAVWYRAGDDGVAAHHDPGWFSINVVNTGPGLMFRDERGVWTEAPPGVGVLWVGAAAAASWPCAVVPAVHRVAPTTTRPRLSVWCETCALDQLLPAEKARDVDAATVSHRMKVPNLEVPMDVEIENGEIERAVERVRRLTGLPSSKIITLTSDDALERKLRASEKEEEKTFSSPRKSPSSRSSKKKRAKQLLRTIKHKIALGEDLDTDEEEIAYSKELL